MEPGVLSISHLAAISKEILIVSSDLLPSSAVPARLFTGGEQGPAGPLWFAKWTSGSSAEEIFAAVKQCAWQKAIALNRPLTAACAPRGAPSHTAAFSLDWYPCTPGNKEGGLTPEQEGN